MSAELADAYRAALELVREALDPPHAKTVGDDDQRRQIIHERLIHVLLMIGNVLERDNAAARHWALDYCRERLAEHPAVGYHPNTVPIAYGMHEPCADDGCGHRKGSHWEHAEPGGPRTGCGYLGCACTAYAAEAVPEPSASDDVRAAMLAELRSRPGYPHGGGRYQQAAQRALDEQIAGKAIAAREEAANGQD